MKKMKLSTPKKEYIEKVMCESSPHSDTERTASPMLNVKTKQNMYKSDLYDFTKTKSRVKFDMSKLQNVNTK